MSKAKRITGTVNFIDLATGFWGITEPDGTQWRPVAMPDQLKREGKTVQCVLEEVDEEVSIFMWGTPARIVSFYT